MLRSITKTPVLIANLKGKIKLPDKLKGTILEKWANYWKNLFIDYKQMLLDLRTDIQDEPRKAFLWTTGIAATVLLAKNNPTEIDYKDTLKKVTNNVILVSEECRNTKSIDHLRFVEQCYNEGLIHYRSFGIASVMYTSDVNESCDLYKAHCSYLQPTYLSFASRIVDFGIMGRWWNVHIKTTNYDINMEDNNQK